ncbi:MAG: 3-hydroxyacyl-CoA dehydrogenase NAD-binding domain-containing protein [Thermoplasmataceae archaeon]
MKAMVIGAGTMGRGIAQVFAQAGNSVIMTDIYPKALEDATSGIRSSLERLARKGEIKEDISTIMQRIVSSQDLSEGSDSDIFVEAAIEKVETKETLLAQISQIARRDAIIGTNTSSISINQLSSSVTYPERFIGIHFFNPVPVMKLVEIVKGERTPESLVRKTFEIVRALGKDPVISQDFPGFISNRVLMPMIREAILVLEEGVATKNDIDKTMKLGMNHPMGPLELADFIGLDVTLDIMEVLYHEYGDPRFKAPVTLRNLVNARKLGRKTGEGFYKY